MRELLTEAYSTVHKMTGVKPNSPAGFYQVLTEADAFKTYALGLAEGLEGADRKNFLRLVKNTRKSLLENSMFQLHPHETLTIPILRNFYPKLISKELVNVMPIDKPDVVKAFVKPKFRKYTADSTGASYSDYDYEFPSTTDISRGPTLGISSSADTTTKSTDVLTAMGISSATASHLEKNFKIKGIIDSTSSVTTVDIRPTVDGNFSVAVTHDNAETDVLSGHVDFLNGYLYWSSQSGATYGVRYEATASLEENSINPTVKYDMEKIHFTVEDRRISAEWTTNMEQDAKALFDISVQSEIVNICGEQIALDIDRETISDLIAVNSASNPASHGDTFYKIPPSTYALGQKEWSEQIVPKINTLSAQIYSSTNMGSGNTLACNPLDAAIFENLNGFKYLGNSSAGGEVGYSTATVANGKWKLLVSNNVPQGSVLVKYRSDDLARAVHVFAPYVPALLTPYPLGNNPSLSIVSRYARKTIRSKGVAVLTISDGTSPTA